MYNVRLTFIIDTYYFFSEPVSKVDKVKEERGWPEGRVFRETEEKTITLMAPHDLISGFSKKKIKKPNQKYTESSVGFNVYCC